MRKKMRKKMRKRWIARIMAMAMISALVFPLMPTYTVQAEPQTALGTIYYVDSEGGSDSNSGTSQDEAFQTLTKINSLTLGPGDQVLLKKGSVFESQGLHIQGSGSEGNPIIVSTYGEGDRPKINANGQGQWYEDYGKHLDNQNHKWKGTVSSAILLKDVEYIEISGLELTNDREAEGNPAEEKAKAYNDADCMDRTGVAGVAKDKGTLEHIVLDDLYIHDVDGNVYNKHMANGGIYFVIEKPTNESSTGISRYQGLRISNCHLSRVNRWGIAVGYTYNWDKFLTAELSDAVMTQYGSSGVVIENNYLYEVGGDAITTMYLDRPLVQYNVSDRAAKQINTTDYAKQQLQLDASGNPTGAKLNVNNGRVAAGIWPWKCKDAVFQYNECFNTLNASQGNGDGQPWDADYGDGTLYQYNYSHGNTASTIMFCGVESVNNTFRYNISQYEDMGPLDPAGNTGYTHVYNNTFFIKEGLTSIWSTMHSNNGPVKIENNIFYFAGESAVNVTNWNPSGNKTYDYNLYYNVVSAPTLDSHAVKVDIGEPLLVNAGTGPSAVSAPEGGKATARKHDDPSQPTAFDGYKLAEGSRAVNAGKVITDENGYAVEKDFFGNRITAVPEIGAAESTSEISLVLRSAAYTITGNEISDIPRYTTLEEFLNNLISDNGVVVTVKDGEKTLGSADMVKGGLTVTLSYGESVVTYTTVASTDNALKSAYYEVDGNVIRVPYTPLNPTTSSQLKQNLTVGDTAEISILNGESELMDAEPVSAGMTVRITAENGAANDFTIEQKNAYHWVNDYTGPHNGSAGVQGNVWFGQQRSGGEWQNLTEIDTDRWPNWMVAGTWPLGVDSGQTPPIAEGSHGLIGSPYGTDGAMTFRVPKDGVVSFSIKDDEPYFRQDNSDKGDRKVTLQVLENEEIIDSIVLDNLDRNQQASGWSNSQSGFGGITVKRGDFIRVVTVTEENSNADKNTIHITPEINYLDQAVPDEEAPDRPRAVRSVEVSETRARIVWVGSLDNVAVVGYDIYVNGTKHNTELITDKEYFLTELTGNTAYEVTVKAVDAAGNESEAAEPARFTTSASSPVISLKDGQTLGKVYDGTPMLTQAMLEDDGSNPFSVDTKNMAGAVTWEIFSDESLKTKVSEATNAGTYWVRAKVAMDDAGGVFNTSDTISFVIEKVPLTIANVTFNEENGEAKGVAGVTFAGYVNSDTHLGADDYQADFEYDHADRNLATGIIVTVTLKDTANTKNYKLDDSTYTHRAVAHADIWITGFKTQEYTGSKTSQTFTLYDGDTLLKEGVDYTVTYKNNINAYEWAAPVSPGTQTASQQDQIAILSEGTVNILSSEHAITDPGTVSGLNTKKSPQVIIKMKGNYTGTHTVYYQIKQVDIDEAQADNLSVTFTGKPQKPVPVVTWNGKKLVNNKDFVVREYASSSTTNLIGKADGETVILHIDGKGNFTGTKEIELVIGKKNNTVEEISMSKVRVKEIKTLVWNQETVNTKGGMIQTGISVKYKNTELKDAEYRVSYANHAAVGTATIILEGTGNDANGDGIAYIGTKRMTFKITGNNISKAQPVGLEKQYTYTGEEIKPTEMEEPKKVRFTWQANKNAAVTSLEEGTHYDVTYQKNINKGTATIILTGKPENGYTGTKKLTFKIVADTILTGENAPFTVDITDVAKTVEDGVIKMPYMKGGVKPKVTVQNEDGEELILGTDYTVSYKNNTKVTAPGAKPPTVVVKGKGNYAGTVEQTFEIMQKDLGVYDKDVYIVVNDKVENPKKNGWKQSFKVYDADGKVISAKDYDAQTVKYEVTTFSDEGADHLKSNSVLTDPNTVVPAGCEITVTVTMAGGNYKGEVSQTYRILKKGYDISKANIAIKPQKYTGEEIEITENTQLKTRTLKVDKTGPVNLSLELENGKPANIKVVEGSYQKNVNKGTAKVTFEGVGEFGGTKTVTFKIGQRSIKDVFNEVFDGWNWVFN